MNETGGCYVKWNKPGTKKLNTAWSYIYCGICKGQIRKSREKTTGCQRWEKWEDIGLKVPNLVMQVLRSGDLRYSVGIKDNYTVL